MGQHWLKSDNSDYELQLKQREHRISRAEFLQKTAALAAIGVLPCLFGCMTKMDSDATSKGGGSTLPPEGRTLTTGEKTTLDAQGYLNIDGIVIIKDGTIYRAFSRTCPHQQATVTANSATDIQCTNHTDQHYDKFGAGNGSRTSASLTQYTVTETAGTLKITS